MSSFLVGLDLGQAADYTALVVIERVEQQKAKPHFHVRHIQRFQLGTSYPVVVERVKSIITQKPLEGKAQLVVDATGVGAPVVDLLRQAGLSPVAIMITGGDTVSQEPLVLRVPKRDLVSTLQILLQEGRLKVAESLPEASILVKELLAFQVKITASAHDVYGSWREGSHDDVVLAICLAAWYSGGEKGATVLNRLTKTRSSARR